MSGGAFAKLRSEQPSAATVRTLTQIWQRVLQRFPIGPSERFFDVGGTDELADKTFGEIAKVFNRRLPAATICYAPTISALASMLEEPTLPRFSPFVELKSGSKNPPILIAPGVGGRASFSDLAKQMRTNRPIYGMQAKGVDGMEEPFERIEDIAAYYLDALPEVQSEGPYILIGYSFGGLVALEMAQRLLARQGKIALLVLADSYPHPRFLPLKERLRLGAKRMQGRIADLMKAGPAEATSSSKHKKNEYKDAGRGAFGSDRLGFAATTAHVKKSDFRALERYRPQFYPGKMHFVRPESGSYLPSDPVAIWKNLTAELQVEIVPGNHLSMVATHYESLAEVLSRYVREALPE
jgi:thioesterase domain-containing protein